MHVHSVWSVVSLADDVLAQRFVVVEDVLVGLARRESGCAGYNGGVVELLR